MNKLTLSTILFLSLSTGIPAIAQDTIPSSLEKNNWGGKLIKSPFGLGLDVQTKYV